MLGLERRVASVDGHEATRGCLLGPTARIAGALRVAAPIDRRLGTREHEPSLGVAGERDPGAERGTTGPPQPPPAGPRNTSGWMNLFERWAKSEIFQRGYETHREIHGRRFRNFCTDVLELPERKHTH